jgi:hypothetical protein
MPGEYITCANKNAWCCHAFIPEDPSKSNPMRLEVSRDLDKRLERLQNPLQFAINVGSEYWCIPAFQQASGLGFSVHQGEYGGGYHITKPLMCTFMKRMARGPDPFTEAEGSAKTISGSND